MGSPAGGGDAQSQLAFGTWDNPLRVLAPLKAGAAHDAFVPQSSGAGEPAGTGAAIPIGGSSSADVTLTLKSFSSAPTVRDALSQTSTY